MSRQIIQVTDNICRICLQPGNVRAVEKLPNGTAMLAIHEDGTEHHWLTYDSLDSISYKKEREPRIINCPKCHHRGRLGEFHQKGDPPDKISYYVYHGPRKGYWGKGKNKIKKTDRCWFYTKEDKEVILKRLGRYIEESESKLKYTLKSEKHYRGKTICPKCKKDGYVYSYPDRAKNTTRTRIHHTGGKRCYLLKNS